MAERHSYLGLILGVLLAAAVSFLISLPILKFMGKDSSLEEAQAKKDAMKRQAKGNNASAENPMVSASEKIKKIAFAVKQEWAPVPWAQRY